LHLIPQFFGSFSVSLNAPCICSLPVSALVIVDLDQIKQIISSEKWLNYYNILILNVFIFDVKVFRPEN